MDRSTQTDALPRQEDRCVQTADFYSTIASAPDATRAHTSVGLLSGGAPPVNSPTHASAAALQQLVAAPPGARVGVQLHWRRARARLGAGAASWDDRSGALAVAHAVGGDAQHGSACTAGGVAVYCADAMAAAVLSEAALLQPSCVIDAGRCATAVACYPGALLGGHHLLLAVGTCAGGVSVWGLTATTPAVWTAVRLAAASHAHFGDGGAVVALSWQPAATATAGAAVATLLPGCSHALTSCSASGEIICWGPGLDDLLASPLRTYQLRLRLPAAITAAATAAGSRRGGASAAATEQPMSVCCGGALAAGVAPWRAGMGAGTRRLVVGCPTGEALLVELQPGFAATGSSGASAAAPPQPSGASLPWELAAAAAVAALTAGAGAVAAHEVLRAVRDAERVARDDDDGSGGKVAGAELPARGSHLVTLRHALLGAARRSPSDGCALFWASAPCLQLHAHHGGPVTAVAASPHHRHVFATAGADGTLQVRSSQAKAPLLTLRVGGRGPTLHAGPDDLVTALAWSPSRPCVLLAGTASGSVLAFDLFDSTAGHVAQLQPAPAGGSRDGDADAGTDAATAGGPAATASCRCSDLLEATAVRAAPAARVTCIAMHRSAPVAAIGAADGALHLWLLPRRLTRPPAPHELAALNALAAAGPAGADSETW